MNNVDLRSKAGRIIVVAGHSNVLPKFNVTYMVCFRFYDRYGNIQLVLGIV